MPSAYCPVFWGCCQYTFARNSNDMKKILYFLSIIAVPSFAQNVGIGTVNPTEKLEINGAIKIGESSNANPASGTIRWNAIKNDFEGFNGTTWVSLTGGKSGWGTQSSYSYATTMEYMPLSYGSPGVYGKNLGASMAAYGNLIVAGAPGDINNVNGVNYTCGSIVLFRHEGNKFLIQHKLAPENDQSGTFGESVDISAHYIIAGAPQVTVNGQNLQGKAYIYPHDENGLTSNTPVILEAGDGSAEDRFGASVAIDGDYAVVGAPYKNVGLYPYITVDAGKVYIFQRNGSDWTQVATLMAPDKAESDLFGSSVAIEGDYMAVASPGKTINGIAQAGKVYVYRRSGNSWNLIGQHLTDPAPAVFKRFGSTLCLKEGWLFVSSPYWVSSTTPTPGSVNAYRINDNTVTYHSTITASEIQTNYFGSSIDFRNGVLLIGALGADMYGMKQQGKAYAYRLINNQFAEQAILSASYQEEYMAFGSGVALTPYFGVVSAERADAGERINNGRLYFFKY